MNTKIKVSVLLVLIFLPLTFFANGKTGNTVVDNNVVIETANEVIETNETKKYIVEFNHPSVAQLKKSSGYRYSVQSAVQSADLYYENERAALNAVLNQAGMRTFGASSNTAVGKDFRTVVNAVALELTEEQVAEIRTLSAVKGVYEDKVVKASLDMSVPFIKADKVWTDHNVSGEGMVVAVLDTGIDYNHPDLGGGYGPGYKVIGGYDFINNDTDPMDDHFHGTHCAGIVAADGRLKGVAPKANLLAYKVLDANGSGNWSGIIAGIERACDPDGDPATDDKADVISMSLGGSGGNPDDLGSQAVNNAVSLGVVVVIAAGNDGGYGNMSVGTPGCARDAITVANSYKYTDYINPSSSRGPAVFYEMKPDVSAPGTLIESTVLNNGYESYTGTSMATPHIAGVAALIMQLHATWTPAEIKSAIMGTARNSTFDGIAQGSGIVDAKQAVTTEVFISPSSQSLRIVDNPLPGNTTTQEQVTFTVRNIAATDKTFTLNHLEKTPDAAITYSYPANITIPAGGSVNITIDIAIDNSVENPLYCTAIFQLIDAATNETYNAPILIGINPLDVITNEVCYQANETAEITIKSGLPLASISINLLDPMSNNYTKTTLTQTGEGGWNESEWKYGTSFDLTHDGEYSLTVSSTDVYGNVNCGSATLVVDSTPAHITVNTQDSGTNVNVTVDADEDISPKMIPRSDVFTDGSVYLEEIAGVIDGKNRFHMVNLDNYNSRQELIYRHSTDENAAVWAPNKLLANTWIKWPAIGVDSDSNAHITYYTRKTNSVLYELNYMVIDPDTDTIVKGPIVLTDATADNNLSRSYQKIIIDKEDRLHLIGRGYTRINTITNTLEENNNAVSSYGAFMLTNAFVTDNHVLHIIKNKTAGSNFDGDFLYVSYNYDTKEYKEENIVMGQFITNEQVSGLTAQQTKDGKIIVFAAARRHGYNSPSYFCTKIFDGATWTDGIKYHADTFHSGQSLRSAVKGDQIYIFNYVSSTPYRYKIYPYNPETDSFESPIYTHYEPENENVWIYNFHVANNGNFYTHHKFYSAGDQNYKMGLQRYLNSPLVKVTASAGDTQYVSMSQSATVANRWEGVFTPNQLGTHTAYVDAFDRSFNQTAVSVDFTVSTAITPTPTATPTATPIPYPAWDNTTVYLKGDIVNHNGSNWIAKWWTKGEEPGANNWNAWELLVEVTPTPLPTVTPIIALSPTPIPTATVYPAWDSQTSYFADEIVTHKSTLWIAKWWTHGNEPGTGGENDPWEVYIQ